MPITDANASSYQTKVRKEGFSKKFWTEMCQADKRAAERIAGDITKAVGLGLAKDGKVNAVKDARAEDLNKALQSLKKSVLVFPHEERWRDESC